MSEPSSDSDDLAQRDKAEVSSVSGNTDDATEEKLVIHLPPHLRKQSQKRPDLATRPTPSLLDRLASRLFEQ